MALGGSDNGVDYVFGLAKNERLEGELAEAMDGPSPA